MNQNQAQQGLTPEKLQLFIAGLSGMSEEEGNKAKLLFIKNEIAQYRMVKAQFAGFGKLQGCLGMVPIFWPVIKGQKTMMNAALEMQREQLGNALSVWKDDLGPHAAELEAQLRELDA